MKTLPTLLASHYSAGTTTLADLLKITRKDGAVFAFTSGAENVTISGQLYASAQGLNISSIEVSAGFAVDNLELTTLDDGTVFSRIEVLAGVWRNADFVISRYNFASPTDGVEVRMAGTIGEVHLHRGYVVAELRGLQQYLQQPIGSVTSKTCRARLGDAMCTKSLTALTHANVIGQVDSSQRFAPVIGGDAFFANVSVALHFDAASGGYALTDSSGNNLMPDSTSNVVTANTSNFKFGTASLYLDGYYSSTEAVVYNTNPAFGFGASDFTVELWINRQSNTGPINNLVCCAGVGGPWALFCTSGGALGVSFSGGYPSAYSSINLNLGAWYFVALVRSGNVWSIYVDGVLGVAVTNSVNVGASTPFVIGSTVGNPCCITGFIDEIRVTKGVARYLGNFAIPAVAFDTQPQFVVGGIFLEDYFAEGIITFTSGANAGSSQKIKSSSSDGYLNASLPFMGNVSVGDAYTIVAGCRKRLEDCRDKFNNALNFQGEPHLPGIDQLTK